MGTRTNNQKQPDTGNVLSSASSSGRNSVRILYLPCEGPAYYPSRFPEVPLVEFGPGRIDNCTDVEKKREHIPDIRSSKISWDHRELHN
ncbi:hypothetical protein IMSHALPRED_001752 [Imshaugia aleurites]|uniref:Uncharacterized protein n=1 Tax=Imshaugia aleurites TaxID=172621 RepID=A0A8H3J3L8_9LECA|nr:hypothetical protein IMSHALPRED_001752 [Imshaugia aleurites]